MKKDAILFIFIFMILLLLSGVTYSYWMWSSPSNKTVVFNTSAGLEEYIVYNEGESHFIGDFQPYSSFCQSVNTTLTFYKTADANNTSLLATIYMDVNAIGDNISQSDSVHWVITEGDNTISCSDGLSSTSVLQHGTFNGIKSTQTIMLLTDIELTTQEQKYTVWIWLDSNGEDLSSLSGETVDTNVWTQIDMGDYSDELLPGGSLTITGNNYIGETLNVNFVEPSVSDVTYVYQWYTNENNSTADGTPISGATTSSLTITEDYEDKYIYVVVRADKEGYKVKNYTDITDKGNNASGVVTKRDATISISNTEITTVYPNDTSFTYEYTEGNTVSCSSSDTSIATCSIDQTNKTVTVTPLQVGDAIITLTVAEDDLHAVTIKNVNLTVTGTLSGGAVTISGNNYIGATLIANVTNTTPEANLTYQWYTNSTNSTEGGTAITGAIRNTLEIVENYENQYLYVVVTANKEKYATKTFSDITDETNNIFGIVTAVNVNLTPSTNSLTTSYPNNTSFTYTYDGDGALSCSSANTSIATCSIDTTTSTVTVTPVSVGDTTITLSAGQGSIYVPISTNVSISVTKGTLTGGSVSITGTNTYNNTLTATVSNTTPTATYSYQWYRNASNSTTGGTAISGATSNTYKLTGNEIGKYVYVVVTASMTNYNSKTFSSITSSTTARENPTLTVSSNSLDMIYPNSSSFTYTYNGDGTITCSSSNTSVSECSVNTSTKTVTVTAKAVGTANITLSASQGTLYNSASQVVALDIHYDTYDINYYMNIETTEEPWKSETKTYDESYTITSEQPTREGYTFLGWSLIQGDSTVIYVPGDTYATNSALELYAVWELDPFSIDENFTDTTYEEKITSLTTPTTTVSATGGSTTSYNFLWSVDTTSGTLKTNSETVSSTSYTSAATLTSGNIITTITFTPTNAVDLSFDYGLVMNDSSSATFTATLNGTQIVSTTSATTSTYTSSTQLTANTEYTLQFIVSHTTSATYSFMGNTGKSTAYAYVDNLKVMDYSSIEYTVTYNANGGTDAPYYQTKGYNEDLVLTTSVPSHSDYQFSSWNTEADGSGTSYAPGATYSDNASITLYAIWSSFSIEEDFSDTEYDSDITTITNEETTATSGSTYNQTTHTFQWNTTDGQFKTNTSTISGTYTTITLNSGDIVSSFTFTPTKAVTLSFDYGLVMNDSSSATLTASLNETQILSTTSETTSTYTHSTQLSANTEYTLTFTTSHTTSKAYSMTSETKTTAYAYIDNLTVN